MNNILQKVITPIKEKSSLNLVSLPDKDYNWHSSQEFKKILRREIARSYRSGLPLSYLIFDLTEYTELKINEFNTKRVKYDRFLNLLIEMINQNTREIDIKCVKNEAQIDLLLVDTDKDNAQMYINKMKKILDEQFNNPRLQNFREIIKSVKLCYYPLNQLTGKGEININSSLKSLMDKEQDKLTPIKKNNRYSSKTENQKTPIIPMKEDLDTSENPKSSNRSIGHKIYKFFFNTIKRLIDIIGSIVGIILFGPVMIIIAFLIKFSSPGPILFKQKRVGYLGKEFTFIKFRSMRTDMDDQIHQEYVKKLIEGKNDEINMGTEDKPVYKIINDPRVTTVGAFIRKTSLDELPQFFNVLIGDMSLVGPRPPIPYEVDLYKNWHLKRIAEVKPGITGMWQAYGRSETTFDDMVRYDIQYVNNQSMWLDIKILFATISSVFSSKGAM
jgi:lipopolysaccharide/colanic/teichoic acid biosynthesis glycosyltransferase